MWRTIKNDEKKQQKKYSKDKKFIKIIFEMSKLINQVKEEVSKFNKILEIFMGRLEMKEGNPTLLANALNVLTGDEETPIMKTINAINRVTDYLESSEFLCCSISTDKELHPYNRLTVSLVNADALAEDVIACREVLSFLKLGWVKCPDLMEAMEWNITHEPEKISLNFKK